MERRFWLLFFVFMFFALSYSLLKGTLVYFDRRNVLESLKNIYEQENKKNIELKTKESFADNPFYIEKIAREQLQYTKEGEKVVIINYDNFLQNKQSATVEEDHKSEIWRLWLDLVL
ncbi:MAG: hypothetical protein KatS3mg090_0581 [Patescibacteria group bacterium]|nr:MAG: hypothetical protein KatS3mg090_0581 [Patescibacteria group bacterium]